MSNEEIIAGLKNFVENGDNYSGKFFGGNQNIGAVSAMKFPNLTRIFSYETDIAAAVSDFIILSENEEHSKQTKSLLNRLAECWKNSNGVEEKIYQQEVSKYFIDKDNF